VVGTHLALQSTIKDEFEKQPKQQTSKIIKKGGGIDEKRYYLFG
jgi:hypothetical protein